MKVLYATQATGNGHLIRAKELIPRLKELAEVDILVSGTKGDIRIPYRIDYNYKGLSYAFGKRGNINIIQTFFKARPFTALRQAIMFPAKSYDLIISDFEPISAWAARIHNVPSIGLSHQAAFLSSHTPRPKNKSILGEFVLKNFAPVNYHIGFHFEAYDHHIETPIIRSEIKQQKISEGNHISVYLPAYDDKELIRQFKKCKEYQFQVFSKFAADEYQVGNVNIYPISSELWVKSLTSCHGVIMGAGFEGPSEALFLGKRLLVIPMKNQYEQYCNAAALSHCGVSVLESLDNDFLSNFNAWVEKEPIKKEFPDNAYDVVERIVSSFEHNQAYSLIY